MKRMGVCAFLFIMFLCVHNVFAIPSPTSDVYVNDHANVLSEEVKNQIFSHGKALDSSTSAQVVVLTVNSLEGKALDDYALEVFRSWGIGNKEKNNGILLLLSIEDRKARIEVGYGLEGAVNAGKAGRILDKYGIPYFKEDNWSEGILQVYLSLLNEVYHEYGKEIPSDVEGHRVSDDNSIDFYFNITVIAVFIISAIFWFKRGAITYYRDDGPFNGGIGGGFGGFGGGFGGSSGGGISFGGGSSGGGGASRGF